MLMYFLKNIVFYIVLFVSILFTVSDVMQAEDPSMLFSLFNQPLMVFLYVSRNLLFFYLFAKVFDIIIDKLMK